ncbi:MAG TPA: hypothetical protein VIX12_02515, partial [Candidatus Binataceae bacterium]
KDVPCARAYYYADFEGVSSARLGEELVVEFESSPGVAHLVCRCEDGRVVAAVAFDANEMRTFRSGLASNFKRHLDQSVEAGRILGGASRPGKVFSSGLLQNTYRDPVASGAILLGDAGLHVDPLFGQGHSLALMSAEIMAAAAPRWFQGRNGRVIDSATMNEFTRARDAELMPYYDASVRTSSELGLDRATLLAHQAAASEPWAADEMVRFAQMSIPRGKFPSFRFARLMARRSRT